MEGVGFSVKVASTFWKRARGLIGRGPGYLGPDEVLCLAPCSSVHTFFMGCGTDIAFIDERGRVVRSVRGLRPGRLAACSAAAFVIERPSNEGAPWPGEGERISLLIGGAGKEDG